jgi:hypothetical protein
MLVEGGYLHSMKKLIEKAAEMPDPQAPSVGRPPKRRTLVATILSVAFPRFSPSRKRPQPSGKAARSDRDNERDLPSAR